MCRMASTRPQFSRPPSGATQPLRMDASTKAVALAFLLAALFFYVLHLSIESSLALSILSAPILLIVAGQYK